MPIGIVADAFTLSWDTFVETAVICSYDVTVADFKNSLYAFGQSEKSKRVQCIVVFIIWSW